MAGALAMGWARGLALLLLLVPAATPGAPGLRHSYDCGVEGMQLLVLPPEGRTVRFKVMGALQCPADQQVGAEQAAQEKWLQTLSTPLGAAQVPLVARL